MAQPRFGIDPFQLGRADQRVDGGRTFAAAVGISEQVVAPTGGDATQYPFGRRVVDLEPAVVAVAQQCRPRFRTYRAVADVPNLRGSFLSERAVNDSVSLLFKWRNFPGRALSYSFPADHSASVEKWSANDIACAPSTANWPMRIMWISSMPASTESAAPNDLKFNIGLVTPLMVAILVEDVVEISDLAH